jgi:hypothetical protein
VIHHSTRPVAVLRGVEPQRCAISECIGLAKAHEDETGTAPVLQTSPKTWKRSSRSGSRGIRARGRTNLRLQLHHRGRTQRSNGLAFPGRRTGNSRRCRDRRFDYHDRRTGSWCVSGQDFSAAGTSAGVHRPVVERRASVSGVARHATTGRPHRGIARSERQPAPIRGPVGRRNGAARRLCCRDSESPRLPASARPFGCTALRRAISSGATATGSNTVIRIISARKATATERETYRQRWTR